MTEAPAAAIPSDARSVATNSAAAAAAQIVTSLAGYALLYVAAVILGRAGVGVMGVLISSVVVGQMLGAVGVDLQLMRVVAQRPEDSPRTLGAGLQMAAAGALVVIAVIQVLTWSGLAFREIAPALAIGSIAILPGAMAQVCEGYLMGRERMRLTTLSNAVEGIARLAIAAPLFLLGAGVIGLAVAMVAGRVLALALDLWLIRRHFGVTPLVGAVFRLVGTARETLTYWALNVLLSVFSRGDVLIVAAVAGASQAGLFVAGLRPIEVLSILPMSLLWALLPVLSRQVAAGKGAERRTLERALVITLAVMAGLATGVSIESELIVRILFPGSLGSSAGVLSIVAWTLLPLSLEVVTASLIMARGDAWIGLITVGVGMLLLIALNLALDPSLGARGGALARVVAILLVAGLNAAVALRGVGSPWLVRRVVGIAFSAILLFAALTVLRAAPLIAIPLGALVYSVSVILAGVFTRDDLVLVRRLLGRRARPA